MDSKTLEILERRYAKLPEALQNALSTESYSNIIKNIGITNKLPEEDIDLLTGQVALVFLGVEHPDDFEINLRLELSVTDNEAAVIAQAISSAIFNPLKDSLKQIEYLTYIPLEEESAVNINPEPVKSPFTNAPVKAIPPVPSIRVMPQKPLSTKPQTQSLQTKMNQITPIITPTSRIIPPTSISPQQKQTIQTSTPQMPPQNQPLSAQTLQSEHHELIIPEKHELEIPPKQTSNPISSSTPAKPQFTQTPRYTNDAPINYVKPQEEPKDFDILKSQTQGKKGDPYRESF